MRFVDANVFLRHITNDDAAKAAACARLFMGAAAGGEEITTSELVIAELAYVLSSRSQYGFPNGDVADRLRPYLSLRGLHVAGRAVLTRAVDLYAANAFLDFEDAMSIARMENDGIAEIISYDTDFDRVPSVRRVEP